MAATSPVAPCAPPGQRFHPRTSLGHHGKSKGEFGVHGVLRGRWYGAVSLRAPRAVELHAAVLANDLGKLWVNGRLVWQARAAREPHALIRIPFQAGENRLVLVCENVDEHSAIGLRLCTRGRPLAPAERAALNERTRIATAALPPPAARGRLGDGSSRYPDADPPLAWDLARGVNIRWHTPLPSYACANPVIAGDQLYVLDEPHTLYALDKDTGAIRWRRETHVFEFVPEAERAEALRSWEAAQRAGDLPAVRELDTQIARAELERRDREEYVAAGARATNAELQALDNRVRALKKARQTAVDQATGPGRRWQRALGVGEPGWGNNYGHTFGAPVADAERVWVKFGTGVAACYDRDGTRRWIAHTRLSGGVGNLASPLLLNGTLVIQGQGTPMDDPAAWRRLCAVWPGFYGHAMIGLDAETGRIKWRRPVSNSGAYGGATGIVPLRLSDGATVREAVLTGDGLLVDPADGRLLVDCRGVGASAWSGDPVVRENRAYFYRGGGAEVVEFWLEPDGRIGSRRLFKTAGGGGRAGLVWHAGRLWGNTGKGSANRQPVPWHEVSCADAATGARVAAIFPALLEGGLDYAAPAAAGPYVVVVGNGTGPAGWTIDPAAGAEIGFVRADATPPYVELACKIAGEAMTATPVFEGGHMYLRTYRSALCVETDGAAGRRFALQTRAAALLDGIAARPLLSAVLNLPAAAGYAPPPGVPVEPCGIQTAPSAWLVAGPFSLDATDPLAALGGPAAARPEPGVPFAHAGANHTFQPLDPGFVNHAAGWEEDLYGRRHFRAKVTIDVGGAAGRRARTVTCFYAVLHAETQHTYRVVCSTGGAELWMGGQRVQNGAQIRLAPGYHPVLVRSPLTVLPPFVQKVGFSLSFRDTPDPTVALQAWLAELATRRPRLEAILRDLPGGPEARTAASLLEFLGAAAIPSE